MNFPSDAEHIRGTRSQYPLAEYLKTIYDIFTTYNSTEQLNAETGMPYIRIMKCMYFE